MMSLSRTKKLIAILMLLAAVVVAGYVIYKISLKPSYAVQYMTYDTVNGTVTTSQGSGYVTYSVSSEATINMTVTVAVKDPYRLHKLDVESTVQNMTNMQVSAFGIRFGAVYVGEPLNDTWVNATLTGTDLNPTSIAVKYVNASGQVTVYVYVNNTLCMTYSPEIVKDSDLGITILHVPTSVTKTCITLPANCTLTIVDSDTHDKAMVTLNLFYTLDLVDPSQGGSAEVKVSGYGARK